MYNQFIGSPKSVKTKRLDDREKAIVANYGWFLESYHYLTQGKTTEYVQNSGKRLFIDSGAFSADSLGAPIDIAEYAKWVNEHQHLVAYIDAGTGKLVGEQSAPDPGANDIALVAGLDVIDTAGATSGKADGALGTYQNVWRFENNFGIKCLPTVHYGEDPRWLDYYVQNYPYICLGGLVTGKMSDLQRNFDWLDQCWEQLTDKDGRARVKVHGFAVAGKRMLERYPWTSADASSWVKAGMYGRIIMHEDRFPTTVIVSEENARRQEPGQHYDSMKDAEKRDIAAFLAEHDWDIERLRTVWESRAVFNIWAFQRLENQINANPDRRFVREQHTFF